MDALIFYLFRDSCGCSFIYLEIHVVVWYETLCLTLGLACDYSLTFGSAYMIEIGVGLLVAYPMIDWMWTVMWLGN